MQYVRIVMNYLSEQWLARDADHTVATVTCFMLWRQVSFENR